MYAVDRSAVDRSAVDRNYKIGSQVSSRQAVSKLTQITKLEYVIMICNLTNW